MPAIKSRKLQKISLASRSLYPQLLAGFCLMSVLPILALLNLIFPSVLARSQVYVIVVCALFFALLGFLLVRKIIVSIIALSVGARVAASGELTRDIHIEREDEIGELGSALNQLTRHIKSNMDELKIYGERTKDINLRLNKQIAALNGLLEISNFISCKMEPEGVFRVIISKLAQTAGSSLVFFVIRQEEGFEVKARYGLRADILEAMGARTSPESPSIFNYLFLACLSQEDSYVKIDNPQKRESFARILKTLNIRNMFIAPILAHGKVTGLLIAGNNIEPFQYAEEDVELMNIFARQLAIALENDYLLRKVEDLEIFDPLTGLYNRRYITGRLNEEILRAISYQRPCAFIMVKFKNSKLMKTEGPAGVQREEFVREMADILKTSVAEADRVGRIGEDEFGIVLPEQNKRQAQVLASRIEDKLSGLLKGKGLLQDGEVVRAGVVENPIDGADSAALISKARELIPTS